MGSEYLFGDEDLEDQCFGEEVKNGRKRKHRIYKSRSNQIKYSIRQFNRTISR